MTPLVARRPGRPPPRGRPTGLALAGALVVVGLLGLLLAASQRAAALHWRGATLEHARVQARADAHAAMAAARQWLLAGGYALPARDCTGLPARTAQPGACSSAALADAPPWPGAWDRGIDGCRHACGFHVQALDPPQAAGERRGRGFRIQAYAAGPAPARLRLDVAVHAGADAASEPRLRRLAWWARG